MEHAHVLLVEDSLDDAELLLRALKKSGLDHTVHHLRNGNAALEYLFGQSGDSLLRRPDVVLLDLHMPQLGGLEVLGRLRSVEATKDLPVITMLGSSGSHGRGPSLEAGATATLEKPISVTELKGVLDGLGIPWRVWCENAPAVR